MKNAMKMLLVVAGILATRSQAYTDYYRIYGNSCHSSTQGLTGEVSQHGLGNASPTQAMIVVCPLTVPQENYYEGYISLVGFDRHGTDALSCTLNFSSQDGDVLNTAVSATKGSANYSVKYGNGVTVAPTGIQRIPWVSCRIPPKYTGGWMSVLTSLYITLSY